MSARFKLQIVRNKQRPQVGALLVLVGECDIAKSKPNEVGLRGKGRIISPVDAVPLAAQHDLAMLF